MGLVAHLEERGAEKLLDFVEENNRAPEEQEHENSKDEAHVTSKNNTNVDEERDEVKLID